MPWNLDDKHCPAIGKERESQPLQHADIAAKGYEDLQYHGQEAKPDGIETNRPAHYQVDRSPIAVRSGAMLMVLVMSSKTTEPYGSQAG